MFFREILLLFPACHGRTPLPASCIESVRFVDLFAESQFRNGNAHLLNLMKSKSMISNLTSVKFRMNRIIDICMRLAPDEIYRKPYQPEPTRPYPEMKSRAGKPRIPVGTHPRTIGKPHRPVGTPPRTVGKLHRAVGKPPRPPPYQRAPVTTLPDIHRNTGTLGTPETPGTPANETSNMYNSYENERLHLEVKPDTPKKYTPEPLSITDEEDGEDNGTPESLVRVASYPNLEFRTISGTLKDNRENYAIYDKSLRLSPVCGEGRMDHDYVVTYHRFDSELAKTCEICHANPYKLRETSARCIDCDTYLCIRCYTKIKNASDVNQKYRV